MSDKKLRLVEGDAVDAAAARWPAGKIAAMVFALEACSEMVELVGEVSMCATREMEGALIVDRESYEKARAALLRWRSMCARSSRERGTR